MLLILLSFGPGLVWLWFFYRQDRRPEPVHLIGKTFLWGALFVLPALIIESIYSKIISHPPNVFVLFLVSVLGIGLVEEAAKLGALWVAAWRHRDFDEPVDGIIYAITGALGFAALENMLYAVRFGLGVVPARALITLLAHASFSGIAGAYLGRARFNKASFWPGLALASVLHGSYDFILASRLPNFLALLLLVASFFYLRQQIASCNRLGGGGP
jgi:RsiW-degrading membrane proteinase PrsW (M82 family)